MSITIYKGTEAQKFMPIIGDDKASVITPVRDTLVTGKILGHVVLYKGMGISTRNNKLFGYELTPLQCKAGTLSTFMFAGTNADVFNHLIIPKFFGRLFEHGVYVDDPYKAMISPEFVSILKQFFEQVK